VSRYASERHGFGCFAKMKGNLCQKHKLSPSMNLHRPAGKAVAPAAAPVLAVSCLLVLLPFRVQCRSERPIPLQNTCSELT
jgi:hypothetical protein